MCVLGVRDGPLHTRMGVETVMECMGEREGGRNEGTGKGGSG